MNFYNGKMAAVWCIAYTYFYFNIIEVSRDERYT